jgi:6-phospho-beta-glucosidase
LTFNEINCGAMPLGNLLGLGIINEGTTDFMNQVDVPQRRFQALHHQFIASSLAVQLGHQIDSDNRIGCMIAYMMSYPLTPNPADVLENQKVMQLSNYLCGDVQVRGSYPTLPSVTLLNMGLRLTKRQETMRFWQRARWISIPLATI